jgi:hypothetical protein
MSVCRAKLINVKPAKLVKNVFYVSAVCRRVTQTTDMRHVTAYNGLCALTGPKLLWTVLSHLQADPRCLAVEGVGLQPIGCWNHGFESR